MEQEKKSYGALIGSIIIIIILILGGVYVWQARIKSLQIQKQMQADALKAITSQELNKLQEDLNTTDTNVNVDVNTLK